MCIADNLREQVKQYQKSTGEETMCVVVEKHDDTIGIHNVGYHPFVGLIVDGKPPAPKWYQEAEAFRPLSVSPTVLH